MKFTENKVEYKSPEEKAKHLVFLVTKGMFDVSDVFSLDNILMVWFSKTLQNWKALVITDLPDDIYYEVTYSGDKKETYVDVYKKIENVRIPD